MIYSTLLQRLYFRAAVSAVGLLLVTPCHATDTWTDIIPGVRYLHRTTSAPLSIYALTIDTANPRVRIGSLIKNDTPNSDPGETTSGMAIRNNALAAINGDYFQFGTVQDHQPQGLAVIDGAQAGGFVNGRMSWAMDGTTLQSFVDIYATTFPYTQPSWMFTAVSGGPRLLRNGAVSIETTPNLPSGYNRDPRTAVGISQDRRKLVYAVVDGRQSGLSIGMTGPELGAFLLELGAWDAINFDSGGSCTFFLNGSVRNSPSDGAERKVANAIAVWDTANQGPNPTVAVGTGFEDQPFKIGDIQGQDGWIRGGTTAKIQTAQVHTGSQALELDQTTAEKTIVSSTDKIQWIDVWMKRQTGVGGGVLYFGASSSKIFGIVGFQNGGIYYWDGNTMGGGSFMYLTSYNIGQWYRISVRVDYNNVDPIYNAYCVYVDGKRYPPMLAAYKDSGSNTSLNFVRLHDYGTGSLFVDDLYVGNTRFDSPRVECDGGSLPAGGYRQFAMKNTSIVSSWQVTDERNSSNNSGPAGSVATVSASGLVSGVSPGSFVLKATDNIGRADQTTRVTVIASVNASGARSLPNNTSTGLSGSVVTAVFSDHVYVEQENRAAGIRVNTQQPVSIGERISAIGTIQTTGGEVALNATTLTKGASITPLIALTMTNREVANGQNGLLAQGLFAKTIGNVTQIDFDKFVISDGSPGSGLIVAWPGFSAANIGMFVNVTGPIGASNLQPVIKPRTLADIIIEP